MSDTPPSLISKSYDEFNEKTTTQMINEFATSMSIFRFKYRKYHQGYCILEIWIVNTIDKIFD